MTKILDVVTKIILVTALIFPALLLQVAAQSPWVLSLQASVQSYWPLYILAILSLKIFSIIYAPLPGSAFTLAALPFLGWKTAYALDIVGGTIGVSIVFFLGRKYGYTLIKKIIGEAVADKVRSIKLKDRNQVEASIFLRFALGGMLSDGLAWGASLIGFKYMPFITGYFLSHLVTTLPVFYFLGAAISFNSWIIFASAAVVAWMVVYTFKGRYFE
ncbi:MAG TPA: VTT domain-containing protein [Vitreimonas sp.]|nr:VTT domain-containing protein [Vitreimonas sp.]